MSENGQSLASERIPFWDVWRPIFSSENLNLASLFSKNHLKCSRTYFFAQMYQNGQTLALEHHFEISEDPIFHLNIWKWLKFSLRILLWDVWGTFFLLRYLKLSRIFFSEHHFDISKDLVFCSDTWKWSEFSLRKSFEVSNNPFFHPDVWKWPEFSPWVPF